MSNHRAPSRGRRQAGRVVVVIGGSIVGIGGLAAAANASDTPSTAPAVKPFPAVSDSFPGTSQLLLDGKISGVITPLPAVSSSFAGTEIKLPAPASPTTPAPDKKDVPPPAVPTPVPPTSAAESKDSPTPVAGAAPPNPGPTPAPPSVAPPPANGLTETQNTGQAKMVAAVQKLMADGIWYRYAMGSFHGLGADDTLDCSGLVSYVLGQAGYDYSTVASPDRIQAAGDRRNAQQFHDESTPVDEKDVQPGDLVFFGGPKSVHHVGIYVGLDAQGNHMMIDAAKTGTQVREEKIHLWDDFLSYGRVPAVGWGTPAPAAPPPATTPPPATSKPAGDTTAAGPANTTTLSPDGSSETTLIETLPPASSGSIVQIPGTPNAGLTIIESLTAPTTQTDTDKPVTPDANTSPTPDSTVTSSPSSPATTAPTASPAAPQAAAPAAPAAPSQASAAPAPTQAPAAAPSQTPSGIANDYGPAITNMPDSCSYLLPDLQRIAKEQQIDMALVMAVSYYESGCRNVDQQGGLGRGPLQVDIGAHPDAKAYQHDLTKIMDKGGLILAGCVSAHTSDAKAAADCFNAGEGGEEHGAREGDPGKYTTHRNGLSYGEGVAQVYKRITGKDLQ